MDRLMLPVKPMLITLGADRGALTARAFIAIAASLCAASAASVCCI